MSFLCKNAPIDEVLITSVRNCPHQVVRVKPTKTQLKDLEAIENGDSVASQQMAERCDIHRTSPVHN